MKTLIKCLLAGTALAGLAGCASYDYGSAYGQPYDYYGYNSTPYYYGNGPYYDYGANYYGGYPGYYYGTPGVGLSFGYSNRDYDYRGRDYRRDWGRNDRPGNSRDGRAYARGRGGRFANGAAVTPPASRGERMSNNPRSEIEAHPGPVGTNQQ
jgi:hypothetical protein